MVYINYYIKFIIFFVIFITTNYYRYLLYISINKENKYNNKNINDIYEKINNYIDICKKKPIIKYTDYNPLKPKISVIIPVFNSNLSIITTLRSIQNQNMTDFEILLIDDFSSDNSIEIIENIQKKDPRIKLIKNQEQKGTLYSRSIGALNSKGEFIMSLDHDDLFTENILYICYKEVNNNNLDIVEFSALCLNESPFFKYNTTPSIPYFSQFKKDGLIVKQPELSKFIYKKIGNKKYLLIDALIWGKCIKTIIYKKALDFLGEEIYKQNICWSEDRIVNFALFQFAESFKFINHYGIIHRRFSFSVGNYWAIEKKEKIFDNEFINVLTKFKITFKSRNSYIAYFELKNLWEAYSHFLNKEKKNNLKNIVLNYPYISKKDRKKLKKFDWK